VSESKYAIGIDLGTTNSVLSYVDLETPDGEALNEQVLPVPQLTAPGQVESLKQLPSFLYVPHDEELSDADRALPWGGHNRYIGGNFARDKGMKTPIRLVSSAKSWLCHAGRDCREAFLPLGAPEDVGKVSPLEASAQYLRHLKDAWDQLFPDAPFVAQKVTITVPASFDPAARNLTVEAANTVGLEHFTLLEEPQAALYSWILNHGEQWRDQVSLGDVILVVDIGGGTTDLSLMAVTEQDGSLELQRVAVGDHILLGGDNMDLALAFSIRAKLAAAGKQLETWQILGITQACRSAKEQLLSDQAVDEVPIVVPSRGASLIGDSLRTELTRTEVETALIQGFFPEVAVTEQPQTRARGALTSVGLPYAQDAAITRHLASFLSRQANATDNLHGFEGNAQGFIKPTSLLFNGGALKSPILAYRLQAAINGWLAEAGAEPVKLLEGVDLDLAVGRGAAYYGYVQSGKGVRIRGGLASSFYVGIESAMPAIPGMEPPLNAICIAPFGMEEGDQVELPSQEVGLVVGEPVRFRFFGSTVRRDDQVGNLFELMPNMGLQELEPIEVNLSADGLHTGEVVPVKLTAKVTEVGTLQLEAVASGNSGRWQVELNVRDQVA